jgi:hypothetical protein
MFNKIPVNTFDTMEIGAGMLLREFNPTTKEYAEEDIFAATTGGLNFKDEVKFEDWGEDVDNAPTNTKELKRLKGRTVSMSGTFVSVTKRLMKDLIATADIDGAKIVPRDVLKDTDFFDFWGVFEYGKTGSIAIHVMNALSNDGFELKTENKGKGQFPFNFMAHSTIEDTSIVPYEIYLDEGTEEEETTEEETTGGES